MLNRVRQGILAAGALIVVAALSGCAGGNVPEITSVEYSQSQALPDFDNTVHTTTRPDDIAALTEVLDKYGVTGDYRSDGDGCPGGRSTDLEYTTKTDEKVTVSVHGDCKFTDFEGAIDELVSSWRARG